MLADLPPSSSVTCLMPRAASSIDVLAGLVAAGEGDLGDVGMRDQRLAHFVAEAGDDVHDARRETRLSRTTRRMRTRRPTRYSDGFHTTVLPAASAGASFQVASSSGEFHGSDGGDDAQRLFAREVEDAGLVDRNHAAFDLVGQAAEIVEPLRDVVELAAHLGDQLAVVGGFDLGEPLGFGRDQVAELAQQRAARGGGELAPFAMEGALRPRRRRGPRRPSSPRGTSAHGFAVNGLIDSNHSPEAGSTHFPPINI